MPRDVRLIKEFIKSQGNKFFTVEFEKKDGTLRKINGHIRAVPGHDGINPTAHIDKYLTVVLAEKDKNGNEQWRNVNIATIKSLAIAGKVFKF
ncbi:MAG: hypothetical protein M0R77_07710 [Gammaproteobacteria bacterium]|nr:hypothetical protein [Gammaproteobacteria bacterium]